MKTANGEMNLKTKVQLSSAILGTQKDKKKQKSSN